MTFIEKDVIAQVREATDLVALVAEHVPLKRSGKQYVGRCPFHPDKHPSFSVSPEIGVYYCFGCQAKGDAIAFVRQINGLDFIGAVNDLAHRAGIEIPDPDPGDTERRKALASALARASQWYHERLVGSPDASVAREYLRGRGIGDDVVRDLALGWAPENERSLARALLVSNDVFVASGLGRVGPGGQSDHLRGRIVFPIRDTSGRVIAFIGRSISNGGPKYLNTPDTDLYHKSNVLYGLDRAKAAIVRQDEAILCEGTIDVIACGMAGILNAVATCGTAVTENHIRSLSHYSRHIVLAYDSDAAGAKAVERFYAWAATFDLDVRVAAIPDGKDPGDLGFSDPDALRLSIQQAVPLLAWRVGRILDHAKRAGRMATPDQRVVVAREAMNVVSKHPDPMMRATWTKTIAERCRVPESALVAGCQRREEAPRVSSSSTAGGIESEVLRVVVHTPKAGTDLIDAYFFSDGPCRRVFGALQDSGTPAGALAAIEESGDTESALLLGRVIGLGPVAAPDAIIRRWLVDLATAALRRLVNESPGGEIDVASKTITSVHRAIRRVSDPATADEAAHELRSWLRSVLPCNDVQPVGALGDRR